jgi:hypothetical protein
VELAVPRCSLSILDMSLLHKNIPLPQRHPRLFHNPSSQDQPRSTLPRNSQAIENKREYIADINLTERVGLFLCLGYDYAYASILLPQ